MQNIGSKGDTLLACRHCVNDTRIQRVLTGSQVPTQILRGFYACEFQHETLRILLVLMF